METNDINQISLTLAGCIILSMDNGLPKFANFAFLEGWFEDPLVSNLCTLNYYQKKFTYCKHCVLRGVTVVTIDYNAH